MPATTLTVLIAALVGGVIGWWPLAAWVRSSLLRREGLPIRGIRVVAAVSTSIVWGVVVWRQGVEPVLPALLAFTAAGVVLAIVDLAEQRLPNRVVAAAGVGTGLLLVVAAAFSGEWMSFLSAVLGGAAMFAAYLLLALIAPSAMGMGDVKLAGVIGMLLGWFGITAWVVGLIGAFAIGGVVAVVALATRRVGLRGSIPFGPSMLAGALGAMLLLG
ncbi:A24 family peptidase [Agromyces sp. LHK192]|uniref:prepilin peptidase n=1 Tax=Agromyces sp. LHK192 TaxID=2498704 RepID=UPI000FD8CBA6|nr:A24 family peptidase [Agromyces sp. LHK192]